MLGADVIAESIVQHGLKRVFLYPGGTVAPTIDALGRRGVELFVGRSEQGSGFAALAMARLTHQPQVLMATSGPGVTNLATVVADAYFDSVPLVVLCGQVATGDVRKLGMRQRGFQEIDTVAMMKPISKLALRMSVRNQPGRVMEYAFYHATHGRCGPVVVDVPMDLQRTEAYGNAPSWSDFCEPPRDEDVAYTLRQLSKAQHPVIIAGQGVIATESVECVRELARYYQVPVSHSMLGLGVMPSNDLLSLGFHGHTGVQRAGEAIYNADLLLVLGSRMDVRQTGTLYQDYAPHAEMIRVDIDQAELDNIRVRPHTVMNIHCDVGEFLRRATQVLQSQKMALGVGENRGKTRVYTQNDELHMDAILTPKQAPTSTSAGLSIPYLVSLLDKVTQDQSVVVVTGVGQHQSWVARHFTFDYPKRTFLTSGGHGTMGFDLPAAMGACLARPESAILCVVGDGSFQMNIQELATVREKNLPVKLIVADNQRLGLVSQFQNLNWSKDLTCGNKWNPDFAGIARAYGIPACTLTSEHTEAQLTYALKWMLNESGPVLLHCICDPTEDISPMLLGGQRIDQPWIKP
jgi:acetolactate synthase I/II/III large subunit